MVWPKHRVSSLSLYVVSVSRVGRVVRLTRSTRDYRAQSPGLHVNYDQQPVHITFEKCKCNFPKTVQNTGLSRITNNREILSNAASNFPVRAVRLYTVFYGWVQTPVRVRSIPVSIKGGSQYERVRLTYRVPRTYGVQRAHTVHYCVRSIWLLHSLRSLALLLSRDNVPGYTSFLRMS